MKNPNANSDKIARKYMDSLVIEERVLGAVPPTSSVTFLGEEFATPIMAGALSHLKNGMAPYAEGARLAGAVCCIGMGDNETFGECIKTGARVIKVIKPYADREEIFSRLRYAEEHGALAVGIDGGHAIKEESPEYDTIVGCPMKLPTLEEMKEYITYTKLPFFIKDILSVRDAVLAKEIGAAGVIIGHHHNLMRWATPPVYLMKQIREAVGEDFILIADGGIDDGFDAFKALAMGADMVCTGRSLMPPYMTDGAEGVARQLTTMTDELKSMMFRTASPDVKHIDPSVIHEAWWL
ncbi:MAG: alpha-hydroxy-acid oxidizing protein [Firmicutes bacterium]|nr:alpha-hydroxy-acid oxidizing protein [Bacillota bacterium]